MTSTYLSKHGDEGTYIYDAVEEEEDASRVAVLAGSGEEEDVVVLDEHVRDAGVVVHHRREHFRITLLIPQELSTGPRRSQEQTEGEARGAIVHLPPCRGAW